MNPFQFKIPTRKKKCIACSEPFGDLSLINSVIKGDEEDPLREDYCTSCFEKQTGHLEKCWGHWETQLKKTKEKVSVDQRAMDLFVEKHEGDDPEWVYFLAHYLKRKKQLIPRPEIKKEGALFFENPITTEVYSIADVEISPQLLKTLKQSFLVALEQQEDE